MSIYISIDGGEPNFLASNNGWASFSKALGKFKTTGDSLTHLIEHGWWEGVDELRTELKTVVDQLKGDVRRTGVSFYNSLRGVQDDSVITVNEGFGPGPEKQEQDDELEKVKARLDAVAELVSQPKPVHKSDPKALYDDVRKMLGGE